MNLIRGLGPLELVLILAIIVLIFGPGRLGKVAGELGRGIRDFRRGLREEEENEEMLAEEGEEQ
jgi:sec-independent protein translocase protein TatA